MVVIAIFKFKNTICATKRLGFKMLTKFKSISKLLIMHNKNGLLGRFKLFLMFKLLLN